MKTKRRFTLDDQNETFTLSELVNANREADPGLAALLGPLAIGQSVEYGGGAAAQFTITRVS